MDSFKVRIDTADRYFIRYIEADDEVDACWKAKDEADKIKGSTGFNLMHV